MLVLRGLCVVVQNLRNRPEFNNLRGNVVSVQHDDRLCVMLHDGGKLVVLHAANVREWQATNLRNVMTLEFAEGSSEQEINDHVATFCCANAPAPETEMYALLRPANAKSSLCMSQNCRGLLVQSARLEHMGALTQTARLLGWVQMDPDAHGDVAYINHQLHMARCSTRTLYLHNSDIYAQYAENVKGDR